LDEQNKICDYLDNLCADVEETISSKNEQLVILEDYKKSLIYEYVTGKKEVPAV
jgi:type I restriction enzyme S subunit